MSAAPQSIDLVIEPRWLIPVEPHGVVLEGHALAVHEGRILELLPASVAASRYVPRERVRLPDHALIPGLVNAHTHNPMTLMRGLADDLPLMTWLEEHIWPAEARVMGPEMIRDGIELAIAEMLRGGTTTCNENYFFPDVQAATYGRLGFRAMVGLPVIEFPTPWAATRDEYFDKALEVHDSLRGDALIGTAFAPHAPYTVSDESFERIRVLSDQLDIPVHLHLHETADEVERGRSEHGARPFARVQRLGLVNERLIAVHMTQLTEAEIEACASAGVSVAHCPESNLKLASGFCPAARLHKAGVNLAIGTDGAASNNDLDMIGEMRTAALLAKGVAGDAAVLNAATTLRAATLGGARALGWEARIGSLEPGKLADLAAIDLSALETEPLYDPVSQIIYAAGRHQVSDVWIGGVRKLAGRVLADLDPACLRARAQAWRERIAAA